MLGATVLPNMELIDQVSLTRYSTVLAIGCFALQADLTPCITGTSAPWGERTSTYSDHNRTGFPVPHFGQVPPPCFPRPALERQAAHAMGTCTATKALMPKPTHFKYATSSTNAIDVEKKILRQNPAGRLAHSNRQAPAERRRHCIGYGTACTS